MLLNILNDMADYLLASNLISFVFCIISVVYMIGALNSQDGSHVRKEFMKFMFLVLSCLVADMLTYVFDMQSYPGARLLNHIFMFLSVFLTAFVGTMWLFFFDTIFRIESFKTRRALIYFLPTVLTLVMLTVNLFTGYIYVIGEDNFYHRGDGYWISFTLQYISYLLILIRAIVPSLDVKTMRRIRMRNAVIFLSSLTLVFGVLQAMMGGVVATHCLGITIGLFIMFIKFQDDQITMDSLTTLNNRYAFDSYLTDKMRDYASGTRRKQKLYVVMMDLDKFKDINDTYGHQEGDNILFAVAKKLKGVGMIYKHSLFLARYAGDEFVAVFETQNIETVQALVKDIKSSVSEIKIDDITLSISVGYVAYDGNGMSKSMLMDLADKWLYIDKHCIKE